MNWPQQSEIFDKIIKQRLASAGLKYSHKAAAEYLGVTPPKYSAWIRSKQKPTGEDLQMLAKEHGFSPAWLLLGEGEPLVNVESGTWPTFFLRGVFHETWGNNTETVAGRVGFTKEELEACLDPGPTPSWDVLKKISCKLKISLDYVVSGQGLPSIPTTPLGRIEIATGLHDSVALAQAMGVPGEVISSCILGGFPPPDKALDRLHALYGLNPEWVKIGKPPTHSLVATSLKHGVAEEADARYEKECAELKKQLTEQAITTANRTTELAEAKLEMVDQRGKMLRAVAVACDYAELTPEQTATLITATTHYKDWQTAPDKKQTGYNKAPGTDGLLDIFDDGRDK